MTEINAGNPILLNTKNHSVVGFGYRGYITRMNM